MSEQASEATVDQAEAGTGDSTGKEVMVITTAVAEYQELADGLTAMYQRCHNMVYDLKTVAGDKQARSDRKQLVSARTALERRRVELNAKDRATIAERIALRDSEALRLESLVRALEQPISEQIAADEARREEERAARMKAEEDRCNAHRARINEISAVAVRAAGLSSAEIEEKHALVTRIVIDKSFEEFEAAAVNAKAECLLRLAELLSIAKQNEERAAQAERDRARLAELEEESRRNREREAAERRQREQQEAEQRRQREEQEAAARRADEIRKQESQAAGEIVTKIGVIRRGALTASSADLLRMVTEVEAFQPGEECGDFVGIALRAKDEAIADLHAAHTVAVQREAEKREADEDGALHCICVHFQAPAEPMCKACPHRDRAVERDLKCWAMVMELRSEEAHTVEILPDNVDPGPQPNCAIECCGDWTDWADKRFEANTLQEALEAAVAEYRAWVRPPIGNEQNSEDKHA